MAGENNDPAYWEAVKDCAKWNSRMATQRQNNKVVYEHQTNVIQRSNPILHRTAEERCAPAVSTQVSQVLC